MRILIASIAFVTTIGAVFLFENHKTQPKEENYAQIVQDLNSKNNPPIKKTYKNHLSSEPTILPSTSVSYTPTPTFLKLAINTPAPTPNQGTQTTFTPTPIPHQTTTPTPTNSPQATPTPTQFPSSTPTPTVSPVPTDTPTPAPSTSDIPQSPEISVAVFTNPVARGNNAELKIKTSVGASCSIKLTLPSGSQSSAQGLQGSKSTDENGSIDWQWKISGSTKPSPPDAKIDITCSKDGTNYSSALQMTITE